MTVHHARTIALAAVLVGISALAVGPHLHAQQPLDDLRALAEQGDAEAQHNLGIMYVDGRGVSQDYPEAVRWWRLAADQGVAGAQHNLGLMYANGQGVPQNYVEAHMWFNLAAAQSSGENRDRYVKARDDLAERMTAEQLAEAQRRALDRPSKRGAASIKIVNVACVTSSACWG